MPATDETEFLHATSARRVDMVGHRAFVGGQDAELWYGIGKLQFHFLVANGLLPSHRFLDVACGSLRLGQYLIPYLDRGKYAGIDGEEKLIKAGLEQEFFAGIVAAKAPRFVCNYEFDLSTLPSLDGGSAPVFDVAMAQSLFTHLTLGDIEKCFRRLRSSAAADARFFFTYFEGDSGSNPSSSSHDQLVWRYQFEDFTRAAPEWSVRDIGDWQHPRGQRIAVAMPI